MNIYIISPNRIWGGAATANMAIAQMLSKEHNVYYNDEYNKVQIDGVIYDSFPTHKLKNTKSFLEHLHLKRIDVVIWGLVMVIPYYRKATKLLYKQGIKQFAIFHSLNIVNSFKGKLMERLVAMSLKHIDELVFVSKYTDVSWSKKYGTIRKHPNHRVIYNPTSVDEGNIINTTSHRIGYVGRFSEEKQPELFAQLSIYDDVNKYIAWGDGPLLGALAKNYPKVDFKGQSSDQKEMYESIDILVMTSKFENCPMVILEAWKYGIPCVVPAVGGIPEIVINGYNGLLYEDFSTHAIVDCINLIKENYTNYSKNSLESVKKFSFNCLYRKWEEILINE